MKSGLQKYILCYLSLKLQVDFLLHVKDSKNIKTELQTYILYYLSLKLQERIVIEMII